LGRNVPGTTYPCHPGGPNDYVFIFAQPQMWLDFLGVIDQPALAEDGRFATPEARWENREALDAIVAEWTGQRGKHDIMRVMGQAGVPCGACQDTGEVLADPHLKAREMIVDLEYGQRGTYQTVGCPIKLSASAAEITRPPELGEHTDDVLRELLQISDIDIARLREEDIV
jgi:formyl-CoA transferase